MTILVDGKRIVRNDVELADDAADWWAPIDVSALDGKNLTLAVDRLREDSQALNNIVAANAIRESEGIYRRAAARAAPLFAEARLEQRPERNGPISTMSITCSSNTIRTAGPGATCTGDTP